MLFAHGRGPKQQGHNQQHGKDAGNHPAPPGGILAAPGLGYIFSKWLFAFVHVMSGGFNQTVQDHPSEESFLRIPAFHLAPASRIKKQRQA